MTDVISSQSERRYNSRAGGEGGISWSLTNWVAVRLPGPAPRLERGKNVAAEEEELETAGAERRRGGRREEDFSKLDEDARVKPTETISLSFKECDDTVRC